MLVTNDTIAFEKYHLYPTKGLLNDPNGLVFFKGQYHVFYQWNPKACDHKYKEWGHFISDDLKTWRRVIRFKAVTGKFGFGRYLLGRRFCQR